MPAARIRVATWEFRNAEGKRRRAYFGDAVELTEEEFARAEAEGVLGLDTVAEALDEYSVPPAPAMTGGGGGTPVLIGPFPGGGGGSATAVGEFGDGAPEPVVIEGRAVEEHELRADDEHQVAAVDEHQADDEHQVTTGEEHELAAVDEHQADDEPAPTPAGAAPAPATPAKPRKTAHRDTWVEFAVESGVPRAEAEQLSRADLIKRVG